MSKWANYAIVAVRYKESERQKHIEQVKIREDTGDLLTNERIVSREDIVRKILKNVSFVTAYKKGGKWKLGDEVNIVRINDIYFIRTEGNRIAEDNLGELPEF